MKNALHASADEELVRHAGGGCMESFEELVRRYEHRVYSFVRQRFTNDLDAREVTQDTFIKAFNAIARFEPRRPLAPWLLTIARRNCLDRRRKHRPMSDEPVPDIPDLNSPHELLAAAEERAALWSTARRCLSLIQYEALWLRYAEEMSVAQIAQVLRKSKIHIKVLLFRARLSLLTRLKKDAPSSTEAVSPATQNSAGVFRQAVLSRATTQRDESVISFGKSV